jgi:hypothetical protein
MFDSATHNQQFTTARFILLNGQHLTSMSDTINAIMYRTGFAEHPAYYQTAYEIKQIVIL